jgi:hypothetical protein
MKIFVIDLRNKNATMKDLVMKLRDKPNMLRKLLSV